MRRPGLSATLGAIAGRLPGGRSRSATAAADVEQPLPPLPNTEPPPVASPDELIDAFRSSAAEDEGVVYLLAEALDWPVQDVRAALDG